MKNFLRLFYEYGTGDISYTLPANSAGASLANNGLSVFGGKVQLGQNLGAAGNPAQLLNNREIPLNGFSVLMTGMTFASTALIISQAVSLVNRQQIEFRNAAGTEIGRISVIDNQTTLLGAFAGASLLGGQTNIGIGNSVFGSMATGTSNIALGAGAMQGGQSSNFCIVIGQDSADRNGAAVGDHNIILGNNSIAGGSGKTVGQRNIFIGDNNANGGLADLIGSNNIVIGHLNGFGNSLTNTTIIANFGNNGATNFGLSNVFVIGISTQNVLVGQAVNAWSDNGSRLQVNGSISFPIQSTAVNLTLDATMYAVIFTASATATLPTAAAGTNRKYYLVAQGAAVTITTSINYTNLAGASVNTIAPSTSAVLQSNGANWIQIK